MWSQPAKPTADFIFFVWLKNRPETGNKSFVVVVFFKKWNVNVQI